MAERTPAGRPPFTAIVSIVVIVVSVLAVVPYAAIGVMWQQRVESLNEANVELGAQVEALEKELDGAYDAYLDSNAAIDEQHVLMFDKVEDKSQALDYFEIYADWGQYVNECSEKIDSLIGFIIVRYMYIGVRESGDSIKDYCGEVRAGIRDVFEEEDAALAADALNDGIDDAEEADTADEGTDA